MSFDSQPTYKYIQSQIKRDFYVNIIFRSRYKNRSSYIVCVGAVHVQFTFHREKIK